MTRSALLAAVLAFATFASAQEPAYRSDPKFQKAVEAAHTPRLPNEDRLSAWKKANKIADGKCTECLREIITLNNKLGEFGDAIKAANQLAAIATEPNDKFYAQSHLGSALLNNSDKPKPAVLQQAFDAFTAALAIAPHSPTSRFQLGRVLALMGKDPEAAAAFTTFLADANPTDPYRTRAEHFAANPHLAALRMAPPFTIHTAQGDTLSLDSLNGKVILMDFWATWCGPCKQTLPDVKRIASKYKDAPLVVISVSRDANASAWSEFIAKEGMTWPQYRDGNNSVANAYGVTSIPRFFAIDTDGVLTEAKLGSDTNIDGMVNRLVAKAIKAQKNKPTAPAATETVGQ